MDAENTSKLNRLLASQPVGIVLQSSWLKSEGYSPDLQKRYRSSRWLKSIGSGAMIRSGDRVGYEGAIYALQKQSHRFVHPGGRTALSMLGKSHYLSLSQKKVAIFGELRSKLPGWFKNYDWGVAVVYYQSSFLPKELGLTEVEISNHFTISISGPVRALMECLYLATAQMELIECYKIMEGLNNVRPAQVQQLLEQCKSIKVKRLFMYMAEKANHPWAKSLNLEKVDMGSGKRSIVKNGKYVERYQITVPAELATPDGRNV